MIIDDNDDENDNHDNNNNNNNNDNNDNDSNDNNNNNFGAYARGLEYPPLQERVLHPGGDGPRLLTM